MGLISVALSSGEGHKRAVQFLVALKIGVGRMTILISILKIIIVRACDLGNAYFPDLQIISWCCGAGLLFEL